MATYYHGMETQTPLLVQCKSWPLARFYIPVSSWLPDFESAVENSTFLADLIIAAFLPLVLQVFLSEGFVMMVLGKIRVSSICSEKATVEFIQKR